MPVAVILQLIATFGPAAIQLIDALIKKWGNNETVTPDEWATLSASLKLSAADHMTNQLKATGIDPASPQGAALLALIPK